jgi:hypothetical protein
MANLWKFVPASVAPAARRLKYRTWDRSPLLAGLEWSQRSFTMPAPRRVKWTVLHRYGRPTDTWVETGTFLGLTTEFLSRTAKHVYSIEPEPKLAANAQRKFAGNSRVTIVKGLSEDEFAKLLPQISGPVSFWLDGHFSAGFTHQGPSDTPIREELNALEPHLDRFPQVTILVDDVRCFDPDDPNFSTYPNRTWLVNWADAHGMKWAIDTDIFAMWR